MPLQNGKANLDPTTLDALAKTLPPWVQFTIEITQGDRRRNHGSRDQRSEFS